MFNSGKGKEYWRKWLILNEFLQINKSFCPKTVSNPLFWSGVFFFLCVCVSGDGRFSPTVHRCVFPDDVSFTRCQCSSQFIFLYPCLCYFLSPSSKGVHSPPLPPSIQCSVLCSTCGLLSSCLCHHLSVGWCLCLLLASFLILHPSLHDGITTYLHYYALKNMRFVITFPFCGDSLLARGTRWSVGGPAVLAAFSFCLSIYLNLSISLPLST